VEQLHLQVRLRAFAPARLRPPLHSVKYVLKNLPPVLHRREVLASYESLEASTSFTLTSKVLPSRQIVSFRESPTLQAFFISLT
jgi:hypothetical protein